MNSKKYLSRHHLNDKTNSLKRNHKYSANQKDLNNEDGHSVSFSDQKDSIQERAENLLDATKGLWDKRKSFNTELANYGVVPIGS
ncbi:hypothetical protein AHF37_07223 [Paragonimus kellicotti]|nr:hypothetical protein AHF37_07223 [Paragonimus kellicotti]